MAMTLASGATALLESVIRPVREAFVDCAMTEWAGTTIRAANVMRKIVASKRSLDFCQAPEGISGTVSSGKRELAARPRDLVRNWRRSISLKSPKKSTAKDLSSSRRSDLRSTRFSGNNLEGAAQASRASGGSAPLSDVFYQCRL